MIFKISLRGSPGGSSDPSIFLRAAPTFVSGGHGFTAFRTFRSREIPSLCGEQTERYRFQFYVEQSVVASAPASIALGPISIESIQTTD